MALPQGYKHKGSLNEYVEAIHGLIIPDFPSYSVTKDGEAFSFRKGPVRKLNPYYTRAGYPSFSLRRDGDKKKYCRTAHRLVMETYVGPRPEGQDIRHLDHDKRNSRLSNLAYGTRVENIYDSIVSGQRSRTILLTREEAKQIYDLAISGDFKLKDIAEKFGIAASRVSQIKNKKEWKHIHL